MNLPTSLTGVAVFGKSCMDTQTLDWGGAGDGLKTGVFRLSGAELCHVLETCWGWRL